jgi:PQQ-like domain
MTPDQVDALLQRIPPPSPTPQLRDRVLAGLARRMEQPQARRRGVWGGLALAMAIGGFAAILWIVLPKISGPAPGEGKGRRDDDPAFARKVWESRLSQLDASRVTLLDRLYVELSDGTLAALDRKTGQAAWTFRSEGATPLDAPPVISQENLTEIGFLQNQLRTLSAQIDEQLKTTGPGNETQALQKKRNWTRERLRFCEHGDNLYFVSRQVLSCLDRASGALKWTRKLAFAPSGPPLAIRNYLFVPEAAKARVHVLDAERNADEVASYEGSVAGQGIPVLGGPVYADPSIFFVGPDGTMNCFRVTDGHLVWSFNGGAGKVGEPLVQTLRCERRDASGALAKVIIRLLLFSTGSTLYAMDADAGSTVWKHDCGAPPSGAPLLDGETVYVRTEKGTLLALEALPEQKLGVGRVRWQVPGCSQLLMKGRRGIYLLGSNQEILRVNESTGEINGRFPDARLSHSPVNLSDGLLYTARPGGGIVCFEEAD